MATDRVSSYVAHLPALLQEDAFVGRFLLTFVREERVWFWGLQEAQIIALFTLIASVMTMMYLLMKRPGLDKSIEL